MENVKLEYCHRYDFESGYTFTGHRHLSFELNAVISGEIEITCDENVYILGANDFILIPRGVFHRNRITTNSTEMTVVEFFCDSLDFDFPKIGKMDDFESSLFDVFMRDTSMRSLREDGQFCSISPSSRKLFEVFLDYIYTANEENEHRGGAQSATYGKALAFMKKNIRQNISVSDIARECNVCATSIKKAFSHYTGMGCIDFFGGLKLEEARKMLRAGKSCAEVSSLLGYSSQAYFSKKFKTHFGIAPSKVK